MGIGSVVILCAAKVSQEYIIAASGLPFIAGAITLIHGKVQAKTEVEEIKNFAFQLIPVIVLAVGTFIIGQVVSDWNWWNHLIQLNTMSNTLSSSLPNNEIVTKTMNIGNMDIANNAVHAVDGGFAIALYYFLGIGLMILEITKLRDSEG